MAPFGHIYAPPPPKKTKTQGTLQQKVEVWKFRIFFRMGFDFQLPSNLRFPSGGSVWTQGPRVGKGSNPKYSMGLLYKYIPTWMGKILNTPYHTSGNIKHLVPVPTNLVQTIPKWSKKSDWIEKQSPKALKHVTNVLLHVWIFFLSLPPSISIALCSVMAKSPCV